MHYLMPTHPEFHHNYGSPYINTMALLRVPKLLTWTVTSAAVTLQPTGTIRGRFVQRDLTTPVVNAQVAIGMLFDPETAQAACDAGVGAVIERAIGKVGSRAAKPEMGTTATIQSVGDEQPQ